MEKTVVELFAGVGGFRVGLNNVVDIDYDGKAIENGDWKFVWANQWEPSTKTQPAFECYKARFKKEDCSDINEYSNISIQNVDKEKLPNHTLLVGGFPCQDYSVARSLSNEKGIHGKKGVLFWDIVAILEAKKPPFVLLENVDRLLKSPAKQRGRDFGIMLRSFYDQGYNVEWRVINAADYGGGQRRRRTFIFAWNTNSKYNLKIQNIDVSNILTKDGLFASAFPITSNNEGIKFNTIDLKQYVDTVQITKEFKFKFENTGCSINGVVSTFESTPIFEKSKPLKDTLQHNVDSKYYLNKEKLEKFEYLKGAKKIERTNASGFKYIFSEGAISYPEDLSLPSRTMLTSEGTVNRSTHVINDLDTGRKRLLTPVEAERLQNFPDNWTNTGMTDHQRFFMMGNALVTYVIRRLGDYLSNIIIQE